MKFLVIGNIFKSISLQVDDFCLKDTEEHINHITKRDSGAAIVVSTIAALLGCTPFLFSKIGTTQEFEIMFDKLYRLGVDLSLLVKTNSDDNFLFTIYDKSYDRKGYSYIPNGIQEEDLLNINYSYYDAVFFCFLHANIISEVFGKNSSILNTVSILLPSGTTYEYFKDQKLIINPSYFFANRGEIKHLYNIDLINKKTIDKFDCGSSCLVITMGKDGVLIKEKNAISHYPVETIKNIKHPGGAGDAFATGFIFGKINGLDYEECCKIGHKCAKIMLEASNIETIIDNYIR